MNQTRKKGKTEEFMLPTNDYVFKRIFGHKGNESITKDLLKSILNIEIGEITLTSSAVLEKDLQYDNSIEEGQDYKIAKKTIVILLANFEVKYEKDIPEFRTSWHIREDKYREMVLTDLFEFHIISLKQFEEMHKKNKDENKVLASWLKFIRNPNLLEETDMENPEIKKAKKEYNKIVVDEHERYLAEQRLIRIMDEKAIRRGGFNDGKEEGEKMRT